MLPLQYDDEPGSWGRLSEGWSEVHFGGEKACDEAFQLCAKEHLVPYGSYVRMGKTWMRFETAAYAGLIAGRIFERMCSGTRRAARIW
jgi:hypothetical protein